jgi:hydrogenase-4 component F
MQISFSNVRATIKMEENLTMVWPQYALLLTSLVLCIWIPDTLYQTIIHAVNSIGGGF